MITPAVGRKVWFRLNAQKIGVAFGVPQPKVLDSTAPMDATVVFVHSDRKVNLLVVDHVGNTYPVREVMLLQGDESFKPVASYCEWMDYQIYQAQKEAAKSVAEKSEAPAKKMHPRTDGDHLGMGLKS